MSMKTDKSKASGAIYVGRFNPIHVGHIRIIEEMLSKHGVANSLLIIGSSNADFSLRHFFSYHERKGFIKKIFPDVRMVGLPDYNHDREWLDALYDIISAASMDPSTVVFFGGCQEDIRFFMGDNRKCTILNRFEFGRLKISATEVRDALILGRSLEGMVYPELIPDIKRTFAEKWEKFKKI